MRTITIASTSISGLLELPSGARTWGQLKDTLRSHISNVGDMRAVVRETRVDLESDDAMLPEGPFTLLLTVKKIKAGTSEVDIIAVLEDVKERFSESIDDIIEGIREGDYTKVSTTIQKATRPIPSDLQRELEALKREG